MCEYGVLRHGVVIGTVNGEYLRPDGQGGSKRNTAAMQEKLHPQQQVSTHRTFRIHRIVHLPKRRRRLGRATSKLGGPRCNAAAIRWSVWHGSPFYQPPWLQGLLPHAPDRYPCPLTPTVPARWRLFLHQPFFFNTRAITLTQRSLHQVQVIEPLTFATDS